MAAVDFYILGEGAQTVRLKAACQLIEQAFLAGERVLVWLENAHAQTAFDNLLWTFGDRSFVPHEPLAEDPRSCEAPVQLFAGSELPANTPGDAFTTLVMLRNEPSGDALRFQKIIEVLDAAPACRAAGRDRFRFYREHGATPNHHELKDQRPE
jgi:DNA polymerase-3 subunit chi